MTMAEPVVLADLVVPPTATLATAFDRVRAAGVGLVMVVDGDVLVGTLTDGAVRRAALATEARPQAADALAAWALELADDDG